MRSDIYFYHRKRLYRMTSRSDAEAIGDDRLHDKKEDRSNDSLAVKDGVHLLLEPGKSLGINVMPFTRS
jgi:hypothetical protein